MNGATALIQNLPSGTPDYTGYFGALISLDLNRTANAAASDAGAGTDAGDAGGDAGPEPLGQIPSPWTPGNVKGFSFVVTAEPGGPAVPPLRFQAAPTNSVPADDHFCKSLTLTSGSSVDVLFSEIVRNCYDAVPGPAMFADPAGYTQLQNIQWQVSAEVSIAYMFDFCVSDIKPILN